MDDRFTRFVVFELSAGNLRIRFVVFELSAGTLRIRFVFRASAIASGEEPVTLVPAPPTSFLLAEGACSAL